MSEQDRLNQLLEDLTAGSANHAERGMSDYSREDVETWLEANPWDADIPEEFFTDTVGFHWHVLGRRTAELGGELRKEFERAKRRADEIRDAVLRRYFGED